MHTRIRKAREEMGYTREKFAEKLDVSVSYLAELERGRTGISVKMLIKVCNVLGLSADYVLFGKERTEDELRLDAIRRIDEKYLPLLDKVIEELQNYADYEADEASFDYLQDVTDEDLSKLENMLTETFNKWARETGNEPNFYTVEDVEEYSLEDGNEL